MGHGQTTDTENTNQLHLRATMHLQFPQLRQRKAQEKEVGQDVQTGHDGPDPTDIDTIRFDGRVPDPSERPALEDHRDDHDSGVGRCEETDGPEHTFELLAWEDASEEEKSTDFDDADGWGVKDLCREDALIAHAQQEFAW